MPLSERPSPSVEVATVATWAAPCCREVDDHQLVAGVLEARVEFGLIGELGRIPAAQAEHQVQRRLLLDVVVRQGAAVLELLAREDQALLVRRDALLRETTVPDEFISNCKHNGAGRCQRTLSWILAFTFSMESEPSTSRVIVLPCARRGAGSAGVWERRHGGAPCRDERRGMRVSCVGRAP